MPDYRTNLFSEYELQNYNPIQNHDLLPENSIFGSPIKTEIEKQINDLNLHKSFLITLMKSLT